ncbi:cytochrome C oxidase subunit IV family protein [Sphingobium aromaticiconvertens]|uniref:cytochrome C oxidase subunit IV family protein n=1 Tax=Sphingobium aromaticiconvertens TaxID=365341 RepID=UPI003019E409
MRTDTAKPGVYANRITLVWAMLVAATLLSFESMSLGSASVARALILLIAFTKVLLLGREFMELRHAPPFLLCLFQGWVLVTCVTLLVLFQF